MSRGDYFWNEKQMYEEALAVHGESPKSMHWLDYRSAAIRYRELLRDITIDGKSILDAGCGMGDLIPFLYAKSPNFSYLGVDINESFIDIARKRYDGHQFKVLDPFKDKVPGRFDIVVSSGVMNAYTPNWLSRRQKMIQQLYDLAGEIAVFNMAGSFKEIPHDHKIAYAKIQDILDFCLSLTLRVKVNADYSSIDFTVTMLKN